MTTALWILLSAFMILFFATGICTLLAIMKFGPNQKTIIVINQRYLNRLFTSLLLEVVTIGIAVGAITVKELRQSTQDISKAVKELRQSTQDISKAAKDLKAFTVTLEEFLVNTRSWINEPSGLTSSNLIGSAEAKGPFALAVDDEEPEIYVVEKVSNYLRVRRALPLSDEIPEDLEAITFDGQRYYYATTSFRQLGTDGQNSRKLLKFEIDNRRWVDIDYSIKTEVRDISNKLGTFLKNHDIQINVKDWSKKQSPTEDWHPWALEIEGISVRNSDLLIGLKWPLNSSKNAIIVSYNWDTDEFKNIYEVDLSGKGITDLFFDPGKSHLLVAANPPAKEKDNNTADERNLLGESAIYAFNWRDFSKDPIFLNKVPSVARTKAKLED